MKHFHVVQLNAGTDPALNRREYLLRRVYDKAIAQLADMVDLDADTWQEAVADLDQSVQYDTGMNLWQLVNRYNQGTAQIAIRNADTLLLNVGAPGWSPGGVNMNLVNQLTNQCVNYLDYFTQDLKDQLTDQLQQGYMQGESIPTLRNRIQGVTNDGKVSSERFARTMTNEVYNQAHEYRYTQAGIPGVQYSASDDERTCEMCGALQDTVWRLGDPNIVRPPVHFNCRCRLLPWLDDLPKDAGQVDGDVMDYYQEFKEKYWNIPSYA